MKKFLLLFICVISSFSAVFAQNPPANCSELFISEYTQGQYNNRALEIYNPTNREIDLSLYRISRNSNGGAAIVTTPFPAGSKIGPYKTYVAICDKRDTTQYATGAGQEYPIYDGYEKWDSCRDANGKVTIDSLTGKPDFCVQTTTIAASIVPIRSNKYNDFLDLKCRAGVNGGFFDAIYTATANAYYFNGNDAMMLFKGTPDLAGFTNLVDMVGIYNDPGMVSGVSWKDWRGRNITLNTNMLRKREVKTGTGLVAFSRGDTLRYNDWLIFGHNKYAPAFQNLAAHTCDCDPAPPVSSRRTCNGTIIVGSAEIAPATFRIYPNPSQSGNVTLEADGDIENVQVIDLMGRVVENRKMPITAETIQLTLNVPTSGLYFVKITTTDKRVGVQKLMVRN
jgi:Secretion system C-terminal sorting domain/Lamin Tail Domain